MTVEPVAIGDPTQETAITHKQPPTPAPRPHIQPETLGEVALSLLYEYVTRIKASTFATEIGDDRRFQRAAIGSRLESVLSRTANKMGLDLIDMLGILERTKGNVLKQVDAQQSRQLYERAKRELDERAAVAANDPDPVAGKVGV